MGKPKQEIGLYAEEIGISVRRIRRLGGLERLKALSPEIRYALVKPHIYGASTTVIDGGMKARGFRTRKRGLDREEFNEVTNGILS